MIKRNILTIADRCIVAAIMISTWVVVGAIAMGAFTSAIIDDGVLQPDRAWAMAGNLMSIFVWHAAAFVGVAVLVLPRVLPAEPKAIALEKKENAP